LYVQLISYAESNGVAFFSKYKSSAAKRKGLIPRALFLGEMRNISPVSFELRAIK
jgi:hypothetical protein